MKIFTLLMSGLCVAAGGAAQASSVKHFTPTAMHHDSAKTVGKSGKQVKKSVMMRAEDAGEAIWCPVTQKISSWERNGWALDQVYTTSYTSAGQPAVDLITEGKSVIRETNTYDVNGMLSKKLSEVSENGGVDFVNSRLQERIYDEVLTSVIVDHKDFLWIGSQWEVSGNNYIRKITRDADGNITDVEIAPMFLGEYDPTQRLHIVYGADGKAETLTQSMLEYDYSSKEYVWAVSHTISDIVWERTNGQIVDIADIYSADNRILSAKMVSKTDDVDIKAEYDDSQRSYAVTMTGTVQNYEGTTWVQEFTDIADNGSHKFVETFIMEEDGEQIMERYTDMAIYDSYGYATLMETVFTDGEVEEVMAREIGEITYDETYGYPLVLITKGMEFDEDTDEPYMANLMKIEFSDYVDALAGIEDIAADGIASEPEYFNIQGVRVPQHSLTPGIYVRRAGSETVKVVIR